VQKRKKTPCPIVECKLSARLTFPGLEPVDGYATGHWSVLYLTCGYLPARKASSPIDHYQIILLGDWGTIGVNYLRTVATQPCPNRESNPRPLFRHPSCCAGATL